MINGKLVVMCNGEDYSNLVYGLTNSLRAARMQLLRFWNCIFFPLEMALFRAIVLYLFQHIFVADFGVINGKLWRWCEMEKIMGIRYKFHLFFH